MFTSCWRRDMHRRSARCCETGTRLMPYGSILRNQGSGHLWQGRFFSCVLDDSYLWAAVRYVEQNSVRAALVNRAEACPWSSASAHCGLRVDPLLSIRFHPARAVGNWGNGWLERKRLERRHSRTNPHGEAMRISCVRYWLGREDESRSQSGKARSQGSLSLLALPTSLELAV